MHAHGFTVTDVGWKARPLVEGARVVSVVAALSRSLYVDVEGEIVWLAPPGSTLHGRTIVVREIPDVPGAARLGASFDLAGAREWRPPARAASVSHGVVASAGRRLARTIEQAGRPDGFGTLLVGGSPAFPLDRAAGDARSFLAACARDDARAATALAERLLGLGPGLTPAGDDLVGGAFFGLITSGRGATPSWRDAADAVRAHAPRRTHRISAALLGDLLDGEGYAPLHDVAGALARRDADAALEAATRLVRIGHSSGWDLLAGCLGALGALADS